MSVEGGGSCYLYLLCLLPGIYTFTIYIYKHYNWYFFPFLFSKNLFSLHYSMSLISNDICDSVIVMRHYVYKTWTLFILVVICRVLNIFKKIISYIFVMFYLKAQKLKRKHLPLWFEHPFNREEVSPPITLSYTNSE